MQVREEVRRCLGGEDVPGLRVHFPPGGDVGAIRRKTGVSQTAFARQIGISVAILRNRVKGRRRLKAARVLLALLVKDPHIVKRMGEAA